MKRNIAILGILLTTTIIIISGSEVAAGGYGSSIVDWEYVTNKDWILGSDDDKAASLGTYPTNKGWIIIDLGAGNAMPPNTQFWVNYTENAVEETYDVAVAETDVNVTHDVGDGDDQSDHSFYTPSTGISWRYIILHCDYGATGGSDNLFGPEIDSVGWW